MEPKKKKKLAFIISSICLVLILATAGIVFAVVKNKDKKSDNNPATNVSVSLPEKKRIEAEIAIIERKIPTNYNGTYQFSHISGVEFNADLTDSQILQIYKSKHVTDKNAFIYRLTEAQLSKIASRKEALVFQDGNFTRVQSNPSKLESGLYYGNDDLAEVTMWKSEEKFKISLTCYSEDELSASQTSDNNQNRTKLFVYVETFDKEGLHLLFTTTYVYELMEIEEKIIPDENLDFDL